MILLRTKLFADQTHNLTALRRWQHGPFRLHFARGANGALVLLGAIKSDGAQNLSGRRFKAVDRLSFSEHRGGLHIAGEEARVARDAESLEVVSCHGTGRIRA